MTLMADFVETLRLAKDGDQGSLRELISRFQAVVRGVCFDVRIDSADLSYSDLQQEVWLRVWFKLDQFVGSPDEQVCLAMFRRWLRTTSRNVMLNVMQSRRAQCRWPRTRPISLNDLSGGPCVEPVDSVTPSRCLSEQEEALRIRAALAAIDCPQSRRIIELRFLENRTLHEIADELGLTYDQVRERCANGMLHLEGMLSV